MTSPLAVNGFGEWTEEDVLLLLLSLNKEISDIRAEFKDNKTSGMDFACRRLSNMIGRDCEPASVKKELKLLWEKGSGEPKEPMYPMFLFGAWTRTLPRLNDLYPSMLEKIALAGRYNTSASSPFCKRYTGTFDNIKQRKDMSEAIDDPIVCKCGFAHEASETVYCEECNTWQHIWCYYGTDSENDTAEEHLCENCKQQKQGTSTIFNIEKISDDLLDALLRLDLQSRLIYQNSESGRKQLSNARPVRPSNVQTSGYLSEEDDYGPQFGEIQNCVRRVAIAIRTIAYSLAGDFGFEFPSSGNAIERLGLLEAFWGRANSDGVEQARGTVGIVGDSKYWHCESVVGFIIWTSIFCDDHSPVHQDQDGKSYAELLSNTYRKMRLTEVELQTLRGLHLKAWVAMTESPSEDLKAAIMNEAKTLATKLLSALSSVLKRTPESGDSRPLDKAADWINTTKNGQSRYKLIIEAITLGIELRNSLARSNFYYEFYYPTPFEYGFIEHAVKECDASMIHLVPALIEYEPHIVQRAGKEHSILFDGRNIIHATKEQRKQGVLICKAIVSCV